VTFSLSLSLSPQQKSWAQNCGVQTVGVTHFWGCCGALQSPYLWRREAGQELGPSILCSFVRPGLAMASCTHTHTRLHPHTTRDSIFVPPRPKIHHRVVSLCPAVQREALRRAVAFLLMCFYIVCEMGKGKDWVVVVGWDGPSGSNWMSEHFLRHYGVGVRRGHGIALVCGFFLDLGRVALHSRLER